MPDSRTHDDAPNATSKHLKPEREIASRAVTINRPSQEVYAFVRDLTKAPLYRDDLERVEMFGNRVHWVAREGGDDSEWDSEIAEDIPGKEFTWQAVDKSESSSGRVTFEEVPGRGTVVTVTMAYPQGVVEKVMAKVSQTDPAIRERRALRRLKQLLETGEIATNARNPKMLAEEIQ